jgi:hypothetical protein
MRNREFLALLLAFTGAVRCSGHPDRARTDAPGGQTEHRRDLVPREDIANVLRSRTPALMAIEGVAGTGEGREGADTVLVVFVVRKTPELTARIPSELDGWRVVIREVGKVTAPPP